MRIRVLVSRLILVITVFCWGSLEAQVTRAVDSLMLSYDQSKNDTVYLEELIATIHPIRRSDPQLAIDKINAVKAQCEQIGFRRGVAMCEHTLGSSYSYQTRWSLSLKHYRKAIELADSLGMEKNLAGSLNNMGVVYKDMGNFKQAFKCFDRSYEIKKKLNDYPGMSNTLNNLGLTYYNMKDRDEALNYFIQALAIEERLEENGYRMANALSNIGMVYSDSRQDELAIEHYTRALEINQQLRNSYGVAINLVNLGLLYSAREDYKKAIESCDEAVQIGEALKTKIIIRDACECVSQAAVEIRDYNMAYAYLEKASLVQKELTREDLDRQITALEIEQEFKEKEVELVAEQERQELARQEEKKREDLYRYLLITGCIALLVIMALVIKNLRDKKRQKHVVEEKNKNITDSITYATRIQKTILPDHDVLDKQFTDHFVFYKPKDLVSGDFYWALEHHGMFFFAVADCTGHGVPGALISVVCHNALNVVCREEGLTEPGQILDRVSEIIEEKFVTKSDDVNDGMDIALCMLNPVTRELSFSGANNPLYLIRDGELQEIKGDKQPIGKYIHRTPFSTQSISLQDNDQVYLFTDGFADQFGGERGKKFKYKPFKELLLKASSLPSSEQLEQIGSFFQNWKGDHEQVDDVCLLAVRV